MQDVVFENEQTLRLRASARVVGLLRHHNIFIGPREQLVANDDLIIEFPKSACLEEFCAFPVARRLYTIGAFSYSQSPEPNLAVGRYCSIAHNVSVLGERHPIERVTSSSFTYHFKAGLDKPAFSAAHRQLMGDAFEPRYPANRFGPIPVLYHDVWIGQSVQIARGLKIGTGAVVGAGSVVTRDVEPYAVMGGIPARTIRSRFSDKIVSALLELEWWQLHPSVLFLHSIDDPGRFANELLTAAKAGPLQRLDVGIATWKDFTPEQVE